jgi:hypothetical protein
MDRVCADAAGAGPETVLSVQVLGLEWFVR